MNVAALTQFYSGKKVFLTGHTGFKGSWLLCMLRILGAEVKGYALKPENERDIFHVIKGDDLCTSVIADILDKERLKSELLSFQPDFIFHLAAQPLVRKSYEIPSETFETNAIGTANLLEAIRYLGKDAAAVFITTDKVYENKESLHPYKEADRLGGHDPYSASKACAEIIIESYRKSFFSASGNNKGIAVARAGNVIGGGDWAKDRIIPDIVRAFENHREIVIRNPDSVRPWQHVLEPLTGYLILGAKLSSDASLFSEAFNFGPLDGDAIRVEDLVKLAIEIRGSGHYKIRKIEHQPHEAGLLKLDTTKAIEQLKWKPRLSSKEALVLTMEWYKSSDPLCVTKEQINNYWELQE